MRALILNGEHPARPLTHIQAALSAALREAGYQVESITLHQTSIKHCVGCWGCWVKTPGECVIQDDNPAIADRVINSDLVVLLSPVTFGGYSAELKRFLDHMIPLIMPYFTRINGEVHHKTRYEHYPDLLGVGVLDAPHPAQAALFDELIARNALNMHATHTDSVVVTSDAQPQFHTLFTPEAT
ncbi:MAG: flavodoxin family protein [Anaerolineae bacterium]